jgi:hypothetical protein
MFKKIKIWEKIYSILGLTSVLLWCSLKSYGELRGGISTKAFLDFFELFLANSLTPLSFFFLLFLVIWLAIWIRFQALGKQNEVEKII